jgi:putative CocE/NonD family hydrolase
MMRFILADLRWSAERLLEILKRYLVLPFFEIPSQTPDRRRTYPGSPLSLLLETDLWHFAEGLRDRAQVPGRPNILAYTSAELDEDLPITGPISATLYAASSAQDTDFTAALMDVFPDGYCHPIQEGIARASFRDSDQQPSLIEPGCVYRHEIDLWSTSYVIRARHQVCVEISSSNSNRFDRNPNTGDPFGMRAELARARQTIYHDGVRPPHVTLPVMQGDPGENRLQA